MDYIVSAAAVRAAHLLGERPCWQNSIYLAGTRCKCQWGPRDPVWNVSDHPSQDLSSLCGDRAGWGGIFFFIFSHGGNRSLFQLELRDLLWDCSGGERNWVCHSRGRGGKQESAPCLPLKTRFLSFSISQMLNFSFKKNQIKKGRGVPEPPMGSSSAPVQPPWPALLSLSLLKPGTFHSPRRLGPELSWVRNTF